LSSGEQGARSPEGADLFAADFGRELGNEVPAGLAGGGGEEILEGGAGGALVDDFVRAEAGELVVVGLDGRLLGFEVRSGHRRCLAGCGRHATGG
jgi:hypothetical protein